MEYVLHKDQEIICQYFYNFTNHINIDVLTPNLKHFA
jgi:hypothetical protein